MAIFARKHFSQSNAAMFSFLISVAIILRACAAIVSRFFSNLLLPLLDFSIIYGGFYFLKNYWEIKVKQLHYPPDYMYLFVPAYVLMWIASMYISGGYDRPIKISKIIRGIFTGTIFILVCYALLNEEFRFSRALILIGSLWAAVSTFILRIALNFAGLKNYSLASDQKKKLILVAEPDETKRILSLLQLAGTSNNFIGFVSEKTDASGELKNFHLGGLLNLNEIIDIYQADEVIFSARDFSSNSIINQMLQVKNRDVEYKIAPPESMFIIGSNSINDRGDFYFVDINAMTNPVNQRNKRLLDLGICLMMIPLFVFLLFMITNFLQFIKNWFYVLIGKFSWVGFSYTNNKQQLNSPMKKGVLSPADSLQNPSMDAIVLQRLNLFYAKEYKLQNDLQIIRKGLKHLGRKI
jgi:hypothetical protein